jgi:PIN domain nuclease of toxin-antitoxin system
MKILIDTHVLIYVLSEEEKLTSLQKLAINNRANHFFVSHISFFEIAIKQAIGKLSIVEESIMEIEKNTSNSHITIIPITTETIAAYTDVPLFENHRDPFDRFIIATAKTEGLSIMTNDEKFKLYEGFVHLWK